MCASLIMLQRSNYLRLAICLCLGWFSLLNNCRGFRSPVHRWEDSWLRSGSSWGRFPPSQSRCDDGLFVTAYKRWGMAHRWLSLSFWICPCTWREPHIGRFRLAVRNSVLLRPYWVFLAAHIVQSEESMYMWEPLSNPSLYTPSVLHVISLMLVGCICLLFIVQVVDIGHFLLDFHVFCLYFYVLSRAGL